MMTYNFKNIILLYTIFFQIQGILSFFGPRNNHAFYTLQHLQAFPQKEGGKLFSTSKKLGDPICDYHTVTIPSTKPGPPSQAINVEDLTPTLQSLLKESQMKNGVINIISRHTTTAITINERESRLAKDMEQYFLSLAPPDERSSAETATPNVRYLHNDIDKRPDSPEEAQRCRDNGWDIDDPEQLQAWRDQEPINAHSHLLSMLLGSSESIPVVDGEMVIGQWQSILLVDLDGPRERTVGVQFLGYQ